jgi:hypothetical protein
MHSSNKSFQTSKRYLVLGGGGSSQTHTTNTGLQVGPDTVSRLGFASATPVRFSDSTAPSRADKAIFFINMIITEIIASFFGQSDSVRLLQNLT